MVLPLIDFSLSLRRILYYCGGSGGPIGAFDVPTAPLLALKPAAIELPIPPKRFMILVAHRVVLEISPPVPVGLV